MFALACLRRKEGSGMAWISKGPIKNCFRPDVSGRQVELLQ